MDRKGTDGMSQSVSRSKSSFSASTSSLNLIKQNKSLGFDLIFPLFDQIYKRANLPIVLYYIMLAFFTFQTITVGIYPGLSSNLQYDKTAGDVAIKFQEIFLFASAESSQTTLLIVFAVSLFLVIALIISIIIQAVMYNKYLKFISAALYITRFFFEFVPLLFLCPLGNLLGIFFKKLVEEQSAVNILLFIVTLLVYVLVIVAHYITSFFQAVSVYIPNCPTACWNGSLYFLGVTTLSVFVFLSYVLDYFASYLYYILFILRGGLLIKIAIVFYYFPFLYEYMNPLFCSIFMALAVWDVIGIIVTAGVSINYLIQFIIFIACLLVISVINLIVFKLRRKKVAKELKMQTVIDLEPTDPLAKVVADNKTIECADPSVRQHFINCKIHTSEKRASMYMRVGIAEMSDLFINWSLLKFIAEFHSSKQMKCMICHMLSFFPCESHLLSYYLTQVNNSPNLGIAEKFMIYEILKVKRQRQSSSAEVSIHLLELRRLMYSSITSCINFWKTVPKDIGVFYDIRKVTEKTDASYRDAINEWPNNQRIADDYTTFLIECKTDFIEGLKMKNRSELIELGKNFVIDICFKSFIKVYPNYLKKNILDVKGNFINKEIKQQRGSSIGAGSNMSTGTIDGALDIEREEMLAKACFNSGRLRLAFQRSLENRKCKNSVKMKLWFMFTFLLTVVLALVLLFLFYSEFDERNENMNRQLALNQIRFGLDSAFTTVMIQYAYNLGYIDEDLFQALAKASPATNNYNLNFRHSMLDEITKWTEFSRDNLESFWSEMVTLAIDGFDVFTVMTEMLNKNVDCYLCHNGAPLATATQDSLRAAYIYMLLNLQNLLTEGEEKWQNSDTLCIILNTAPNVILSSRELALRISEDQNRQASDTRQTANIILGISMIVYFILTLPFLLYFNYAIFKELNQFIDIMSSIDDENKEKASEFIKRDSTLDNDDLIEKTSKYKFNKYSLTIISFVALIIGLGLCITFYLYSMSVNDSFKNLNNWLLYGVARGNYMYESIVGTIMTILLGSYKVATDSTTLKTMKQFTISSLDLLQDCNNILIRGNGDIPGCIGENERLDSLNVEIDCHPTTGEPFHDVYACSTVDQLISLFDSLSRNIANEPTDYTFEVDGDFYHVFHIVNAHLIDKMYESADLLAGLANDRISQFHTILIVIVIVFIFAQAIVFAIFWSQIIAINDAFAGAIQLIRRLAPLAPTTNHKLMNYIMNKQIDKKTEKMSPSKSVIHQSKYCVICFGKSETIDVVNNSVQNIFGYTPDQLLGQNINILIPTETNEEVYQTLGLMKNGQSSKMIETNATGLTDNDLTVPLHVTILGMGETGTNHEMNSFVFIIRDCTALNEQQRKAEKAKEQSEKLLYQILPRDIVTRLNAGETDITFVVPCASIIFIDIVRFSDYSANLNPSQIMVNLSTIFFAFDKACHQYPSITKIKLIGDVYMAAGGLFNKDENDISHAADVVRFGLDALTCIDESNATLEASLQVRIGVNTGGPIIAGVLGKDKPVFDIIGDPINVASRLQSTCIPNSVQISQGTFDAIKNQQFNVESRGEIALKGKGMQKAYIVRPIQANLPSYDPLLNSIPSTPSQPQQQTIPPVSVIPPPITVPQQQQQSLASPSAQKSSQPAFLGSPTSQKSSQPALLNSPTSQKSSQPVLLNSPKQLNPQEFPQ